VETKPKLEGPVALVAVVVEQTVAPVPAVLALQIKAMLVVLVEVSLATTTLLVAAVELAQ
jgi:hypothetical protein